MDGAQQSSVFSPDGNISHSFHVLDVTAATCSSVQHVYYLSGEDRWSQRKRERQGSFIYIVLYCPFLNPWPLLPSKRFIYFYFYVQFNFFYCIFMLNFISNFIFILLQLFLLWSFLLILCLFSGILFTILSHVFHRVMPFFYYYSLQHFGHLWLF